VRTVSRFVSFWVGTSTTVWEKGLVKCHMSAGQVLIALTYYTTLTPNHALPDPNFWNQCSLENSYSLKLASKHFHTTCGCQKKPFCPKHTWSVMRQRHKTSDSFCSKW